MANWTFVLASHTGAALTELTNVGELGNAAARRVTFARNRPAELSCSLSHHDPEAQLLLDAVANGIPQVIAYRHDAATNHGGKTKRFHGIWAPTEEELADATSLTLNARDPLGLLEGRVTAEVFDPPGEGITDAGEIMWALIDRANQERDTGITRGTIEPSVDTDVTYERKNVAEAIQELSEIDQGPDFEITPDWVFNVYREQGQVREEARFEHGSGTLDNCTSVRRTTRYPRNRVIVIGDEGVAAQADDLTSQDRYGIWTHVETMSDQIDADVLYKRAQALIRPRPIEVITFTPDLGLESCPRPFEHFGVGDTVFFHGRRGAFRRSATVRINKIDLLIDDDGNESFELEQPDDETGEARIRGGVSVEVIG